MRLKSNPLILLFILPFLNSCINNVDFDQVDVDAEPVLNFPLIFFELDQLDFWDDVSSSQIQVISDVTDIEVFQSSVVRNNLLRLDVIYEVENGFNRGFVVDIDFLDDSDNVTYSFQSLVVVSGINNFQGREDISLAVHPEILNTTKMRVTFTLTPAPIPINPDVEEKLKFESISIFYLRF